MMEEHVQLSIKKKCIIHHNVSDDDEHLVCPQNYNSWSTLLEAAKVRNHRPILEIAEQLKGTELQEIFYHRKCRSLFTMKRDLETLKRKADSVNDEPSTSGCTPKRPSRKSLSESRVYDPICIFCNKVKYLKSSRTREKLTQAVQLRADQRVRDIAVQRGDERLIALTSRDIVAAEAHYHISCYKMYTKTDEKKVENDNGTDEYERYHTIEDEAYAELFEYIRTNVIPNKRITPLTVLSARLESHMLTGGVRLLKDSTRKNMHRKLKSELGDSVDIFPDDKGKLLIVPDSVSVRDVALENQALRSELEVWKTNSADANKVIDQASVRIRDAIKRSMTPTPWPYHPSDVDGSDNIAIPSILERFLGGLLSGDHETKSQSCRVRGLVHSFSQDMIYAVTRGQHKPSKHILLPYMVKTLTGNIEIIRMLNKFGHGMSYDQLEENDTALCLQKLAVATDQVVLPNSIKPFVFTNLAWDNIDRLEETLTGKNTSHRVNGIAVQPKIYGPHLPEAELPVIDKLKQRTVQVDHNELKVYVAGTREGPQPLSTNEDHINGAKGASEIACNKNLLWILARLVHPDNQITPSWTGFNIRTRDQTLISEDIVGYLPTINAPATELTTVFEILKQSDLIRKQLSLESLVLVLDQALYAKAVEIAWKHKELFSKIIFRMGTFHTIMNILGIIGKRFQDAGLKDVCIESGIVAEGSIKGVLEGKQYNRAVRLHKCVYEALMRLAWTEFQLWMTNNHDKSTVVELCLDGLNSMLEDLNQPNFSAIMESPSFVELTILWRDFLEHLRHNNGELSGYWMSYVDMVENILLGLLRASREGNWDLHLRAVREMIPWCFAYDKINYARYLSAYLAQMTNLPEDHPDVYKAFKEGKFSVQLSSSNPFGRIPVDQTTEVTVNKDTQTPGGTARFSLKAGAVRRYYITSEYRSAFLGQVRRTVEGSKSNAHHADLQQPRMKKDEEAVSSVVDLIQGWINPFHQNEDLVSISTAKAATRDIASDLMHAREIGELSYATFKEERLEKDPPVKKFHEPMKTTKLKTFANMCKKKVVKSKGKEIILRADRSLFGRIIVMAQQRSISMEDVLSHPLGPLPWAMSTPEGFLRKTNKAALAATLQKNVAVAEQLPEQCASVIDGMNLVQRVRGDQATFGDIATSILSMALQGDSKRIDVVFDTYRTNSIKNSERSARAGETTSGHQLQSITGTQIVRQWRSLLTTVNNKTSLITFLVSEWRKAEYRQKLQERVLYVTDSDKCYRITSHGSEEVAVLQCQQEEADGRLLLHAAHAAEEGYKSVVICSEDTDVFIMCLAFHDKIGAQLFQRCGTKTRTRIVDVTKVAASVGLDVCGALIGLHAYTGCDTTSAFAGKGKVNALKLLTSSRQIQDTFLELGKEWDLSPDLMDKLESFTCLLYAPKTPSTNVNELRYHLFCAKAGEIESHQLPPCRDCLVKHAERANYQAGIWRRCLQQDPNIPSPVGKGWKLETDSGDEQLVIDWMDGTPAPQAILDLLTCRCPRKCVLPSCQCMKNGLKCTDMCRLPNCENQSPISDDEDSACTDEDADGGDDDLGNSYGY